MQQEQQEALRKQKAEFDSAAERHLAFIDELLADKQALMTRADGERTAGCRDARRKPRPLPGFRSRLNWLA